MEDQMSKLNQLFYWVCHLAELANSPLTIMCNYACTQNHKKTAMAKLCAVEHRKN